MYIEVALYKEIIQEDAERAKKREMAPVGEFADIAYRDGVRAQAFINGKDVLNNGADQAPG